MVGNVSFHLGISIINDSQEHIKEYEEHKEYIEEEEYWSKHSVCRFQLNKIEVAQDDTEESKAEKNTSNDKTMAILVTFLPEVGQLAGLESKYIIYLHIICYLKLLQARQNLKAAWHKLQNGYLCLKPTLHCCNIFR